MGWYNVTSDSWVSSWHKDSGLAHLRPGMVEITCPDAASFKSWRPAEVRGVIATLREAKARVDMGLLSASRYNDLEGSVGLHYNPDGLLASRALESHVNPVDAVTYDWVHSLLQDGVFTVEAQAILQAAHVPRGQVQDMLRDPSWRFPRFRLAKSRELHRIFDPRRVSQDNPGRLKASCSELLGVYAILRHFIECHVADTDELRPQRRSFFAACRILDLLLHAKHAVAALHEAIPSLEAACASFMRLHREAYGTNLIRPKHHWVLDVPPQLARDNLMLDAFVIERTHLSVKAVVEHICFTRRFEASACSSLATVSWREAPQLNAAFGLLGATAELPGCPGSFVADRLTVWSVELAVGDVVMSGVEVGIVIACCQADSRLLVLVKPGDVVERQSDHTWICRFADRLIAWRAPDVRLAVAWRCRDDGCVLVIPR